MCSIPTSHESAMQTYAINPQNCYLNRAEKEYKSCIDGFVYTI